MIKMKIDVLTFLIFVSQVLLIFGKVIILHDMTLLNHEMTLICVSENDGGALVWNRLAPFFKDEYDYYEINGLQKNHIMCEMNANKGCLLSWYKRNWRLTNSLITPMGPVFDQRWEEFPQYESYNEIKFLGVFRRTNFNEVKLSFSVRTVYNMMILICNGENVCTDSCYWIVMNSWNYTQSVIGKCATEVPGSNKSKEFFDIDSEYYFDQLVSHKQPMSENEWRTFVITWNFDTGKIILYNTDKIILSYTDEERQLNSDNKYYIYIKSLYEMYFRVHIYKFLHTTVENATLTSPVFKVYDELICVQLLVGLCAECDAHIMLIIFNDSKNGFNDETLVIRRIVKGSTKAAVHGLPMWQSVTIKKNLINYSNNNVKIQLMPKLNNHTVNPLWAIANVRQCPQDGTLRKNVITFTNYHAPINRQNVTCQKLFYNEHAVVSPVPSVKTDVNLDASYCPLGKIGPKCLVSCEYDLRNKFDCRGTQICYEDGCTCDAGLMGEACSDSCNSNTYGYNCMKTCGSCLYNETLSNNRCDTRTGICSNGCNNTNTEYFYVPPLCQTGVEKPNAPTVISINETTIWANVSITWKNEYEEILILYSFDIQEHIKYNQQSWKKLFRNMTQMTKYFKNVKPGFTYHIRLSLNISGVQIHSDWKVVETKCNPAENFDVTQEKSGMIIDLRINPKQLYSCPATWYYLVIQNEDTNKEVVSKLVPSFPYKFQPLSSHTSFNVTISHEHLVLFSKSISINNVSPLYEAWLIPITAITSFFVVIVIASYFYRRKRRQWNKKQIRNEIALSQKAVIYKHGTKSTITNGMEFIEGPHLYESISSLRASTPEALVTAIVHGEEEEMEIVSLVKVKDFEEYVRQAIESGLLDKQYKTTQQVMKKCMDDAYSDYNNANYITGYKKEKRYIATQGPEPNTVTDFWRMIWQENVLIICMLANVVENKKTKCEQYWPDIDKKMKYSDIIVFNEKQNIFADYSFRTFQVTYGEETRKIEHLHYTAWPDYEVPLNTHSVVTYLKKLLSLSPGDGPVVVHYSGVEKTGIIILCDICLRRAAIEGEVDVLAETISIRSERNNMINNKQQYLYAHLVLVECLFSIPTTVPCNEMLITRIKELKEQLSVHQQRLQNTSWRDEILRQDKVSTVYLKKYPTTHEDSDYLSAVYVDGVKHQNQYLATQLPIQSTIKTFWRMIAEFKVELILMLQPPDLQDPACCEIAPSSGEFKPNPYLNITAKEAVKEKYYTSQKLLLVDNFEKCPREQDVTIMCLTEWKPGKDQPLPPVRSMVTFWQAAESIARGNGPTVTLCHDGVTGCGLYLALSFLLERMAVEKECDVYLAVRAVKRSRTDFVCSLEHLEYLYDAVMTYMEFFKGYANFL